MNTDKRTMAIWEIEFLKCQTKKSLQNYISKYENEPENPYVSQARRKLYSSSFPQYKDGSDIENSIGISKNWIKDNIDLLPKVLIIILGLGLAYILEEGVSNWRKKHNAEANRTKMEALLRQSETRDRMMRMMNEQLQEQIDKIRSAENPSSTQNRSRSDAYQGQNGNLAPFVPLVLDENEIMTEYNSEVASRESPQEFLNERIGSICQSCNGTKKCPACNGAKIASSFGNTYVCNVCNETGVCPACEGTGLASWNR